MNFVSAIAGPVIYTRYEPVEEEDWKHFDSPNAVREDDCEQSGAWVAFFVIRKAAVAPFVLQLGPDLEEIAYDLFSVSTITATTYAYVIASADIQDLEVNMALDETFESLSQRLWAACMRLARIHGSSGCSLFGPKGFIAYDRKRAEELLSSQLDISLPEPK